jgi:protein-disulfide isomerase
MDTGEITEKDTKSNENSWGPFLKFIRDNFLGVSILFSTVIFSITLVSLFGNGNGVFRGSTTVTPPTAQQGSGNQVAGTQATAPGIGDAPFLGNADAPVTVVEFSDYECPFCARFFSNTLDQLKQEYINTGKVKFVYKDFPISSIHPQAQKAAESARCVREQLGDDGYWKMHDKLFEGQQLLGVASFKQWAREVGASGGQFDSCLDSGKYASLVQDDASQGAALGVNGTPTFFIGDKMVVGAVPYEQISSVIEGELGGAN